MKQKILLYLILLCSYHTHSQVSHVLGIAGGGGMNYPSNFLNRPEYNLNYIFSIKFLTAKTEFGLMPNTNFGTVYRTFGLVGFTSNIEKLISCHFMIGGGRLTATRTTETKVGYNNSIEEYYFYNSAGHFLLNCGFFIKPIKKSRFLMGLDGFISTLYVGSNLKNGDDYTLPISFNCSFNYMISQKKKNVIENAQDR